MENEKNTKSNVISGGVRTPLFTGDRKRDTAVSDVEILAEASQTLFDEIVRLAKRQVKKLG